MPDPTAKPRPWMIAAWPGMGNVAVIATGYLVQELRMTDITELPPDGHFDVNEVHTQNGLIAPVTLPRGVFFRWTNPGPGRDLIVFISEAQPSFGVHAYANELLDTAKRLGVERIVTFASLASGLHPAEHPKVWGVATDADTLAELRRVEIEPIQDGQIGGLNGLVLGVAAARGLPGMCLLAEIPFFAMQVPNPKASRAALSVFSVMAGIDISLDALGRQAEAVDRALIQAMERLKQEGMIEDETDTEGDEDEGPVPARETPAASPPPLPSDRTLDQASIARIEQLFEEAAKDSTAAVRLKAELDRLGVFHRYEGRFLDLFRRAG